VRRTAVLIGAAAVVGLLAGVLLDVATFLVARYGPQAGHWSFRGNGALAVPFGLGPAILAGAWVALVLRYRGFRNWLQLGLATLLVGIGFLVLSVIVLFVADLDLMLFIIGWMLVAPALACVARAAAAQQARGGLAGHIGAGVAFAAALVIAFYASAVVLAPGS
jgi:hypothetical protein